MAVAYSEYFVCLIDLSVITHGGCALLTSVHVCAEIIPINLNLNFTMPYYTTQNILCDHSITKLDRIMWYTTFWCPMSANSKLVNNISVALLVFKWAAKIFIVYLGQIYSDQWTNSCYTDILFEGLGVYHLMRHFSVWFGCKMTIIYIQTVVANIVLVRVIYTAPRHSFIRTKIRTRRTTWPTT